ncbi:MAG: tRNA 2-thiouridine(34) synthase MnmA [Clostridia bacterium]|nr:tRNA 2-thiouridine(34) synthase MnmA [Clostridia bacterium]
MYEKALIAMSGGVDSSVAAYLMQKKGYKCIGATMRLHDKYGSDEEKNLSDINDAKSVCNALGIDFHVLDMRDEFKKEVIDRFISIYESGGTPNPCIECNRYMKFGKFLNAASNLKCEKMATGHYARVTLENGRYYLKKAADEKKDQTYFLYSLNQAQLSRVEFPLGAMTKNEIRALAQDLGFVSAHKSDSQDICFVPDGEYIKVIKSFTNKIYPSGDFVNLKGEKIGTHEGIINYTIGQRKGLGTAFGEKVYVKEKNVLKNEVVLAKNEDLFSTSLDACDFNWIVFDNPPQKLKAKAKVRYSTKEADCIVFVTGEGKVHIEFSEPQRAIAKGQAVVIYDDDVVLGGGTII